MKVDYAPFCDRMVERYEGNYGWNKDDPGGPTKFGITCYDLAEYMGKKMDSMAAWAPIVKAMTLQTAEDIYATKYATACDFDALGPGKDTTIFDFLVNSGRTSIRVTQELVGVPVDGVMGPVTLAAVNNYNPVAFINSLCAARMSFLRSLSIWPVFGAGWTARVTDLRSYSLALTMPKAAESPATYSAKPSRIPDAYGKGYDPEQILALTGGAAA